jgi:hypothetical protein
VNNFFLDKSHKHKNKFIFSLLLHHGSLLCMSLLLLKHHRIHRWMFFAIAAKKRQLFLVVQCRIFNHTSSHLTCLCLFIMILRLRLIDADLQKHLNQCHHHRQRSTLPSDSELSPNLVDKRRLLPLSCSRIVFANRLHRRLASSGASCDRHQRQRRVRRQSVK